MANKRASIQDLGYIAVLILVFAMMILIGFKVSDELNNKFQTTEQLPNRSKENYDEINSMFSSTLDNTFLFFMASLFVGALILAFLVRIHPVFLPIYIIILAVIVFVAYILSNIYLELANQEEMVGVAEKLPFISHIFGVLPFVIGCFGFLLAIVLYKTWEGGR